MKEITYRVHVVCLLLALMSCGSDSPGSTSSSSSSGLGASSSSSTSSSTSSSSSSSSSSTSSSSSGSSGNSIYPNYNTNPLAPDASGMASNAVELAANMRLGWNLGNTLEAIGGETNWGNPRASAQLMQAVKAAGFDAVRLPVSWDQYANQSSAKIDTTWLNRVREVVQYAINADLKVLVNAHWDNGWLEQNVTPEMQTQVNAKQRAFWQQIATHLRDFDERLMFASANEPHVENAVAMDVLDSYHQTFVDAVRSTGGRNAYRVLVVQGPITDIERTVELMDTLPADTVANRLMVEVHFYTPYQFALMTEDADWGKQFFYWGQGNHSATDTTRNATWGEEDAIDLLFSQVRQKFVDAGVPVVLGEYCATRRSTQLQGDNLALHLRSRADWHRHVTASALDAGLIPFYWDMGGLGNFASGIFDRNNGQVFDQMTLDALREGANQ